MIKLFILLAMSFFFSGVETAVTAISEPLLSERAKKGDKKAKILLKLKQKPDKLLGTLLLGNNLVNIALTALSTSMLIDIFGPAKGVALATFGVSFMVLIFAEILPKTYAINQTIPFAFAVAYPLNFIVWILGPVVVCLNAVSKVVLKLFPKKNTDSESDLLKEELRGRLSMSNKNMPERGILRGVLDLDEVAIGDILTDRGRLVSLNVQTPIPEILKFLPCIEYYGRKKIYEE
jgi:Mg2+/Co2+ transporter CorB